MNRRADKEQPFPWHCSHCGKPEVAPTTISFTAQVRHDGRMYDVTVPSLKIPVCRSCGEKVFTEEVDRQVNDALRKQLGLLTPAQIAEQLEALMISQKELALRLGVAEATVSRWLNETQIQTRGMDNLLRVFFEFPDVRAALSGQNRYATLGTG